MGTALLDTATPSTLLGVVVRLESETHPDSAEARLAPRLARLPLWLVRSECLQALACVVVSSVCFAVARDVGPKLAYGGAFLCSLIVAVALLRTAFTALATWLDQALARWAHRALIAVGAAVAGGLVLVFVLGPTPEARIGTLLQAIGLTVLGRRFNELAGTADLRHRYRRLTVAVHSQRFLVCASILTAIWAVFLPAVREAGAASGQLGAVSALVGAVTAAIGGATRVAARQRKVATQVVAALDDLQVALSGGDASKTASSWLALERCLRTGVDTGVPFFATPAESEHMRAVMAACVTRVTDRPAALPESPLSRRAGELVAPWHAASCAARLADQLATSRSYFARQVDTAA